MVTPVLPDTLTELYPSVTVPSSAITFIIVQYSKSDSWFHAALPPDEYGSLSFNLPTILISPLFTFTLPGCIETGFTSKFKSSPV